MRQLNKLLLRPNSTPYDELNTEGLGHKMEPPKKQAKMNNLERVGDSMAEQKPVELARDGQNQRRLSVVQTDPKSNIYRLGGVNECTETNLLDTVRSLLTCSVCLEVCPQTSQCLNGHLICSPCALRLLQQATHNDATCPSCRVPLKLGLRRCLLAEQLAAELPVRCQYCGQQMPQRLVRQHENEVCSSRPAVCRFNFIGCTWEGPQSESEGHLLKCAYKMKRAEDIEHPLIENLQKNYIWPSDDSVFCRQLLTQLVKTPGGLRVFRRQVGVFRDATTTDITEGEVRTTTYQSTSSRLKCCGLRRVQIEVVFDSHAGRLDYSLKSRCDTRNDLSFRLVCIRCGDVEMGASDQLHSVSFDSSNRQSPIFSAMLTLCFNGDEITPNARSFDYLSTKECLFKSQVQLLKQSNILILEMLLFKDKTDAIDITLDDGNGEGSTEVLDSSEETPSDTSFQLQLVDTASSEEAQTTAAENTSSEGRRTRQASSYWRQFLRSPTANLLRPLLNLISSGTDLETGNNNAPITVRTSPQSIILTMTTLSRRRLQNSHEENTDDEDSTEEQEFEDSSDEDPAEENENSSEEDEEQESEEATEVHTAEHPDDLEDEEVESVCSGRNNNALSEEEMDKSHGMSFGVSANAEGGLRPLPSEYSLTQTSLLSSPMYTEKSSATDQSSSTVFSAEQRAVLSSTRNVNRKLTETKKTRVRRKSPMLKRRRTLNSVRSAIQRRRGCKRPSKAVVDTSENNSVTFSASEVHDENHLTREANVLSSECGPNPPKRIELIPQEDAKLDQSRVSHKRCSWLSSLFRSITGLSRYLLRSHITTTSPCGAPKIDAGTTAGPDHINPSPSTSAENRSYGDAFMTAAHGEEDEFPREGLSPADSYPPYISSFRADISKEIARLAREAKFHLSSPPEVESNLNSTTAPSNISAYPTIGEPFGGNTSPSTVTDLKVSKVKKHCNGSNLCATKRKSHPTCSNRCGKTVRYRRSQRK
ncbi:unnamed protein product [Calicophoron daubneyi]|uniref:RING-type domain-containing protein n=1 Tax=Calicophoron daubneyi TaxID=300641 RepID=A0AAV2TG14_CALDB